MKEHNAQSVDVICQHSKDGTIIPIRVRLVDEDGSIQTYTIKNYKDVSHNGTRTMPDGVFISDKTYAYECQIVVFGKYKMIRLYYDPFNSQVWRMTV